MESPNKDLAVIVAGITVLEHTTGTGFLKMLRDGVKSAVSAFIVDAFVQTKNSSDMDATTFNVNQSINAIAGGFVGGFVSSELAQTPLVYGNSVETRIFTSNLIGGIAGSETSQLLKNLTEGNAISQDLTKAYIFGAAGGRMVGLVNLFYPTSLPTNIMNMMRDEIISNTTSGIVEESLSCGK